MNPEQLTHIGFLVLAITALLALGLAAIKFVRTVQKTPTSKPPPKGDWKAVRETEMANLREEFLAHVQLISDKIDRHHELVQTQLKSLGRRLAGIEKICQERPCSAERVDE